VIYRTLGTELPDFSKPDIEQEVFFDVRAGSRSHYHFRKLTEDPPISKSNLLSEDKTASLQVTSFSDDGKYFAYAVSRSVSWIASSRCPVFGTDEHQGSDFSTIYVRSTDSPFRIGEDGKAPDFREGQFQDELRFVKFSGISWTPDSKGFFYGVRLDSHT